MPDLKRIATFSAFGYPDSKAPGKYLFTHEQAKALAGKCELHSFDLGADPDLYKNVTEELYEKIKVYRFPKIIRTFNDLLKNWSTFISYRRKLKKIISNNKYDFLLLSFIDPRYLLFLFPLYGYKIAVTAHGFDALLIYDNLFERVIKKLLLYKASLILAVSDFTASQISAAINKSNSDKIKVVYNGINKTKLNSAATLSKEEAKHRLTIQPETKVILSICNLVERKGIDIAIRADKILKNKGYDFIHIIAGNGSQKNNLHKLSEELDLSKNLLFIDRLSDVQIGTYYKAADVFVGISRSIIKNKQVEGFGIVFAEAGFLGVPVVAGKSGGVSSVVQHNKTGFLVDPDTDQPEVQTAEFIEKLFSDHHLWLKISKNAEKFVNANFDWELNASNILRLINN